MHEMWMTNQTIAVEQIYGIDVARTRQPAVEA